MINNKKIINHNFCKRKEKRKKKRKKEKGEGQHMDSCIHVYEPVLLSV